MIGFRPPTSDVEYRKRLPEVMSRNTGQPLRLPGINNFMNHPGQNTQGGTGSGHNGFLDTFMQIAKQTVPWATQQLANRREKMMDTETQGLVDRAKSFNDLIRQNATMRGPGGTTVIRTPGPPVRSPFAPNFPVEISGRGTSSGGNTGSSGMSGFTPFGQESADFKAGSDEMARKYGRYEGGQYKDPTFKPVTGLGSAFVNYAPTSGFTQVSTGPGSTGLVSDAGDTSPAYNQAAESATPGIMPEVQQTVSSAASDTQPYWVNPETGAFEENPNYAKKKKPDEGVDTGGG